MRRVLIALAAGGALRAMVGAAYADPCAQATAIAMNELHEAVSLSTVLKPADAGDPAMCPAAHRVLNAYVRHLALFRRQQSRCGIGDPSAIDGLRGSIDRIRTAVIPRYCH